MDLIVDGLLIAGTVFAGAWCWALSARVRALKSLEGGLGGAIVALTRQIELARATLDEARAGARDTRHDLGQLTARADAAAAQLRLLLAAVDRAGPAAPASPPAAPFPAAPLPAAPVLAANVPAAAEAAPPAPPARRPRRDGGPRLVRTGEDAPEPEAPAVLRPLPRPLAAPAPRPGPEADAPPQPAPVPARAAATPAAPPRGEAELLAALAAIAAGEAS